MTSDKVLETSVIKDLSNHIYEKRKATAYQIESLTKNALAHNDSQTIYRIINELTELTNTGTNLAKMGAITALGSVSVALGSFAIAYFLEDIVKPIFSTFKDTDARVRYYACESLYNVAKIARGEILIYFNEIFDILCILVSDSESSVKNAADILDRLIKDIVSAKATNYVSILQQQQESQIRSNLVDAQGNAIQVNEPQDPTKAFSLPRFIPTLLERMYTTDPFTKKFLLSWLELFDDIPSLELIRFLPEFLKPVIQFLFNNAPSDIRLETESLLAIFLEEIKHIAQIKIEIRKKELEKKKQEEEDQKKIDEKGGDKKGDDEKEDGKEKLENGHDKQEDEQEEADAADDEASIKSDDTTIVRRPQLNEANAAQKDTDGEESDGEGEEEVILGQDIFIDYAKIISILLSFLKSNDAESTSKDLDNEPHEIYCQVQFISINWLQDIIDIAPTGILKLFPECVAIVLKNISKTDRDQDFELRDSFLNFNLSLQLFLYKFNDPKLTEVNEILGLNEETNTEFTENKLPLTLSSIIREYMDSSNELARISSLDWLIFIYERSPKQFLSYFLTEASNNFELTDFLKYDTSNEVILKILSLLAKISESNQQFFKNFMIKLIKIFESEGSDKSFKVEFIVRKLCVTLNSEIIFTTLSEVLTTLNDLDFLNTMIVTLNNILLTSQELLPFRKKLKNLDSTKLEDWQLFASLFQSWCHNAPSAISLCLLTSNYELSFLIIKNLSELEVTSQLLIQLDVLVQLLELPIFMKLRLNLLEPERHPYLFKTLYGLLMILPQSNTFMSLRNRLTTVSNYNGNSGPAQFHMATPLTTPTPSSGSGTTTTGSTSSQSIRRKRIYETLDKFIKVQDKHEEYNNNNRRINMNPSTYNLESTSVFPINLIK
ncbi:Vacuole morphology and inheritance protein 14 [Candida viswanathii]|uniref:Vacuole morphology and inheritance protein 14 n=1 Tax=Candida viswanathii TaxID=5486 RepID=A0A367YBS3_9ASCO|nr:Vacuole morphology and inheritance protein 14 [Candida viswanathii]